MTEEQIVIWSGERRLLPSAPHKYDLELNCTDGKGYLRVMSQSQRRLIRAGESCVIGNGEIATLSGIESTTIELKHRYSKEN